jgi:hypothetical protein
MDQTPRHAAQDVPLAFGLTAGRPVCGRSAAVRMNGPAKRGDEGPGNRMNGPAAAGMKNQEGRCGERMADDAFVCVGGSDGLPDRLRVAAWRDMPGIVAGMSLRQGGVSPQPWASLNCALHVGDDPERVLENRRRLSLAAGFAPDAWTCAEQTHENRVRVVRADERGAGRLARENAFPATDAMITREEGILLASFHADCVPLYFVDPVNRAVGIAHAGWRGTALNVAGATIRAMKEAFGTRPADLRAAIGPSIGRCCYEVDETVVGRVGRTAAREKANGRFMLDLKEANRQFMIKEGLAPNNIEVSGLCTSCRTDLFFSHRAENGRTGRMAAFIGIRSVGGQDVVVFS